MANKQSPKELAKPEESTNTKAHNALSRVLSLGILISGIAAMQLSEHAYDDPYNYGNPHSPNRIVWSHFSSVMQNWGMALIFIMVILAYWLKRRQGGLYWFFWLQFFSTVTYDERQRRVRQQVFERAYAYAIIIALYAIAISKFSGPLGEYSKEVRDVLDVRLIWVTGILLVSLPSMLAAWRNDS